MSERRSTRHNGWPAGAVVDPEDLRVYAAARVLLFAITALVVAVVAWAAWAELEQVARGIGKVIPSRKVQVVQHLEGGILADILVSEGDLVETGQVLMRIDDPRAAADYREKRARYLAVLAAIARLRAELDEVPLTFPPEVERDAAAVVASERALFESRRAERESRLAVLRLQVDQRRAELEALERRIALERKSLGLLREELALSERLARQRIVPRAELLRLRRQVNDLSTQIARLELDVPRARLALEEAEQRLASARSEFRARALKELAALESERARLEPVVAAGEERVRRTEIRSPVRGIVKKLHLTTIGGVIQPAQKLAEIVPLDDTLLVEAYLRPRDIAFIHPGQRARVRITAYDYARYGALEGTVEYISADTITLRPEEMGGKGGSFYVVRVRTRGQLRDERGEPLAIIPGMTAEVDIETGRTTVLAYLLGPVMAARERALRER